MSYFNLTIEDFQPYDWQSLFPIPPEHFYEYQTRFVQEHVRLKALPDEKGAKVYSFLIAMTDLAPNWSSLDRPFVSRMQIIGLGRSVDLADFDEADRALAVELAKAARDAPLRARFADVALSIKFDHKVAREAVAAYLESVNLHADCEHWTRFIWYLQRAIQLTASLGKSHPEFQTAIETAKQLLAKFGTTDRGIASGKILDLLIDYDRAEPSHAILSVQLAERAEGNKRFDFAREYWRIAAQIQRRSKDTAAEKSTVMRIAETHYSEALEWLAKQNPSHGVAAHHLSCAVWSLKQAGASKERVEEVHRRLLEEQKLSMGEMGTISVPIERLNEMIKLAQDSVNGKGLEESVITLANALDVTKFEEFKKTVRDLAGQHPFLALVPTATVDGEGRPTATRTSLWNASEGGNEQAVLFESFRRIAGVQWPVAVEGIIKPAAQQIWSDHQPNIRDLAFIVDQNPVIPPGHHYSFLRGFQAGFAGDLHAVAYFLMPQFEALVRHVLKSSGVIVSKLKNQAIQEVRLLGQLLQLPETTELFGSDLVITMRGLLTEEAGSNLRNTLCHGMLSDYQCHDPNIFYSWWLLLKICVAQSVTLQQVKASETEAAQSESNNAVGKPAHYRESEQQSSNDGTDLAAP
jgi:hypothetical protein